MKITEVRCLVVGAPWRELTLVQVLTDSGLVGLSEVRMVNKTATLIACIRELAPRYLVGRSPFDIAALAWDIQRREYGRPGEVAQSTLSAFEMACWDLMGQHLGVPIHRLLGGQVRNRVPAYANGWYQGEREPGRLAELAARVVERGYRALKLDPFGSASGSLTPADRRRSIAIVEAVRGAIGADVELMIEMHGRFSVGEAARLAHLLEPFDPAWLEEPLPPDTPRAWRRLRRSTNLELAGGERIHTLPDLLPWIDDGLLDIVQVDLSHAGGFSALGHIAALAEAHSLELAPHNVCGPVGTLANVHFAAATMSVRILEHFNDFADPWVSELVDDPPTVDPNDGCFAVPERPGLGVRLNREVCDAHPATGTMFDLYADGWERRGTTDGES